MKKIVVKFGGSNLKERDDILRLVRVVKAYNRPVIIVVSAFYGVTNQLTTALSGSLDSADSITDFSRMLYDLKKRTVNKLLAPGPRRDEVFKELKRRLGELERFLKGVHYIGEIPPSVYDTVLSYGERLSALIVAAVMEENGVDCREALPESIGLYTDGAFGQATFDYERSADALKENLSGLHSYVVPGFYGISGENKVTLFGRGGSDYSAAVIARAVKADSVDLWKDVHGFQSSDPKAVQGTRAIHRLSYDEAAELAYFGAGILHPRAVEPVSDLGIPIRIFNIENVGEEFSGDEMESVSEISRETLVSSEVVKCVSFTDDVGVLRLSGSGVGSRPGIIAGGSTVLEKHRINIKSIITAQTSINFLLAREDLRRAYDLLKNLSLGGVAEMAMLKDLSLIALVGEGLMESTGVVSEALAAVSRADIPLRMTSLGASEVAAYLLVDASDRCAAVQAIHDSFFPR